MRKLLHKVCASALMALCSVSSGQDVNPEVKIRDLRHALISARDDPSDSTLAEIQLHLGSWYLERNSEQPEAVDSAFFYLKRARELALSIPNEAMSLRIQSKLCEVMYRKGLTSESISCFEEVQKHYQASGNRRLEADTWFRRGVMSWRFNVGNAGRYDEILNYYRQALSIYEALGESGKLDALHVKTKIADILMCDGQLTRARNELEQIQKEYDSLNYGKIHKLYYLLGVINRILGDVDRGLFYALKSIENAIAYDETYQLATYRAVVGDIYRELDNPAESSIWYDQSIREWESNLSLGRDEYIPYRFIHYWSKNQAQLGLAKEALQRTLEFERNYPTRDLEPLALLEGAKGILYTALQDYEQALSHYSKSMSHFGQMESPWPIYISELNQEMGSAYLLKGDFLSAKTHLLKALAIQSGYTAMSRRREILYALFQVDSALGSYPSAIAYLQKFKLTSDSIFNKNKIHQIEELQIQYQTTLKESEITSLQNERILQESRLRQTTTTKNFTIGASLLFLLIIGLLLFSYQGNKRSNRILISQKGEIESKNIQLQQLLDDKEWLLREVHHRVKNNLQIVMSLLNTQSYFLKSEDAIQAIQNSQNRLYAISLIHQKLYNADNLDRIDIASYLDDLIHHLKEGFENHDRIKFVLETESIMLDTTRSVPIGLILNEAITNSIKYGFPGNRKGTITVRMATKGKFGCTLLVKDDGVGFPNLAAYNESSSLGLSLIKGLCKQLNATLSIKGQEGVEISIFFLVENTSGTLS